MQTQTEAVDVYEAIETAIRMESGDDVIIDFSRGEPLSVLANRDLLVRSIGNILRNAVHYAGDAGPIRVAVLQDAHTGMIEVSDCGPGVPEQELDKIFKPFYRTEESRTRESGGTGLGLAIVHSCLEKFEGSVVAEANEPNGLIVRLSIPTA